MKNLSIYTLIYLISTLPVWGNDQHWAQKRVNQHMQKVGVKMYHQGRDNDAKNKNIKTEVQVNGIGVRRSQEPDLSGLELEGTSYEVDSGIESQTYYLESPADQVTESTHQRLQADRELRSVQERYVRDVKAALKEAGIKAEIDENLQVYTYDE